MTKTDQRWSARAFQQKPTAGFSILMTSFGVNPWTHNHDLWL